MRQPIRQHRKSKDWMVSGTLTTLFVMGSLWYLGLLPSLNQVTGLLGESEIAKSGQSEETEATESPEQEAVAEKESSAENLENVPLAPEQSEPQIATLSDQAHDEIPATPISFGQETSPVEKAASQPNLITASSPESTPQRHSTSLSEQERIAKLFGTQQPTETEVTDQPPANTIIPASAEKTVAPNLPLTNAPFAQVDQWIADGQYLKAHRELSQRYWKEEEPLEPLLTRLNKTAGMIYFAPQPHFMQAYEIQPGDLLQKVAPKYNLSWEYLARLNRVRPERVKVGQKLKVIKGPFSAFIDLSDFSLTIHAHGYFVKRYAIGIGADNSTPIGTFSVKEKLKNPTYYGPDGVIDADEPSNPLGERWVSIGDSYGIHGTIDPTSIGKAESRGCLRLGNEDIVEVYDFLTPGSEVVIRP
ncbi:MAG: L,D-transpeptidase family protein [Planctomycetaceae bacterium]|nr:L,D-transpeptidase family protein [Planctomycetaceae bacterium]